MKKSMLLAALAITAAASVAPSGASAIWTHNHQHLPAGSNPQIHGEGFLRVLGQWGGITCHTVTATIQLTGGQTTATVNQFNALNAQTKCTTSGLLAGCKVTAVNTHGIPWLAHITGQTIEVTGVNITTTFHGFMCPVLRQMTGNATFHGLEGGLFGNTTADGLRVSPGGTLVLDFFGPQEIASEIAFTPTQQDTYGWT